MKKNYIANIWMYVSVIFLIVGCHHQEEKIHHDLGEVPIDSQLTSLLQPTNAQVVDQQSVVTPSYETKILTIETEGIVNYDTRSENSIAARTDGRVERLLVKYNYQPIKKGQLIMELYAPELAEAQQELLFLKRNKADEYLLAKTKQRLLWMGVTENTIQQILRTEKVNYRVPVYSPVNGFIVEKTAVNSSAPMVSSTAQSNNMENSSPMMLREGQYIRAGQPLFTVYTADKLVAEFSLKPTVARLVKLGNKFSLYKSVDKENTLQIVSIQQILPQFKMGGQFTIARAYLPAKNFRVGDLLTGRIPVLIPKSIWLPETAVLNLGQKQVVFIKENEVFKPKQVQTGFRLESMVQIKEEGAENWQVAKNAAYLVDSESFIKITDEGL